MSVLSGCRSLFVAIKLEINHCFVTHQFSQKKWTSILVHRAVISLAAGGVSSRFFASHHEFGRNKLIQVKHNSIQIRKAT